jgi:predicted LPLAT superfamily acyltransferase
LSDQTRAQWTGEGKGSSAGNRFFIRLIRLVGVLPAYAFLLPACVSYTLFDRSTKESLRAFRRRLGRPRVGLLTMYRHFLAFGMSLIDRFAFLIRRRSPFRYRCIGEDRIADAVAEGHGVILLSAHVGNWEIAGNLLHDRLGVPINVIMLDREREALQQIYREATDQRRFRAIAIVPDSPDAMVETVNRLRNGEVVCLLGDRLLDGRQERVPFLGGDASFPVGPFVLSALTGAPIVPVFTLKTGLLHYTFTAYDAIRVPGARSHRDEAITESLESFVRLLETIVRSRPYQWYNFFDFWA